MSDEAIVEVIEKGLAEARGADPMPGDRINARVALAALRDAGFDVYRPDDCSHVAEVVHNSLHNSAWLSNAWRNDDLPPEGTYRLVPVESRP